MSYVPVQSGSPIVLECQLFTDDATKYPLAYVYDSTWTEVPGSPFSLTYFAAGMYINNTSLPAPADGIYTALYTVYNDSGHTQVSVTNSPASDTFEVSPVEADVASIKVDTDGLRSDYTHARALEIDAIAAGIGELESADSKITD